MRGFQEEEELPDFPLSTVLIVSGTMWVPLDDYLDLADRMAAYSELFHDN